MNTALSSLQQAIAHHIDMAVRQSEHWPTAAMHLDKAVAAIGELQRELMLLNRNSGEVK